MQTSKHDWQALPPARPDSLVLRAGPVSAIFEPDTGFLRQIRRGGDLLVNAIYVAVRDENWSTVWPTIKVVRSELGADRFAVEFAADHVRGELHFRWSGVLTGEADGTIAYEMKGECVKEFRTRRTGVCVLHPASASGMACTVSHPNDPAEEGHLPQSISPFQPFTDIQAIRHRTQGGEVSIQFEGELFEMEDQRNWGDASFKTYCRPQRREQPYTLKAGETVRHRIEIKSTGIEVPAIGTFLNVGGKKSRAPRISLERQRADLATRVEKPSEEIAIAWNGPTEPALRNLREVLGEGYAGRIVLPLRFEEVGVALARQILPKGVELFVGSDGNFTELNRARPPVHRLTGHSWGFLPQVHASDERSILETPETLVAQARSAETPEVWISPIRFSDGPDSRAGGLLGGVWTVGVVQHLAAASVRGGTIVGVADKPGSAAWHVLQDYREIGPTQVYELSAAGVFAFAAVGPSLIRLVIANRERRTLRIPLELGPFGEHPARLRVLDEKSFGTAAQDPAGWRAKTASFFEKHLELPAYAIATLELDVAAIEGDDARSAAAIKHAQVSPK